jgi:hypothetical protein
MGPKETSAVDANHKRCKLDDPVHHVAREESQSSHNFDKQPEYYCHRRALGPSLVAPLSVWAQARWLEHGPMKIGLRSFLGVQTCRCGCCRLDSHRIPRHRRYHYNFHLQGMNPCIRLQGVRNRRRGYEWEGPAFRCPLVACDFVS